MRVPAESRPPASVAATATAVVPVTQPAAADSLLDWVVKQSVAPESAARRESNSSATKSVTESRPLLSPPAKTGPGELGAAADNRLDRFLAATTVGEALQWWLGESFREQSRTSTCDGIGTRLSADIAQIDEWLNAQTNAILHHPRFQRLESSWRGIAFLIRRVEHEADPLIQVQLLTATWGELEKDFDRAIEFDQSFLFKAVYSERFGTAGGHPLGMLIGDYSVRHRVSEEHRHDDIAVLRSIAGVAASAFCPFLCAADPTLLDLESFGDLEVTRDHAERLSRLDYLKWNALRDEDDARFVGVLLPRMLMRGPYEDDGSRTDRFIFFEDVSQPDGEAYLWGNPAYAYAAVAMRSFATSGWLADIRGLRQDEDGGGLVTDLPSLSFPIESPGAVSRPITEVAITDSLERQLSEIGLLPLCDCKDTPLAVFASGQSLQRAKKYDRANATANAKISAMLPYMLTVSRFAHYVKIIARNKVGSFTGAPELQRILHDWIMDYVTADRDASTAIKSRQPLREANISVQVDPSRPGSFRCLMQLAPHYELDDMVGSVVLRTILGAG